MLRKLIYYDLKSTTRFLFIIHLFLLAATLAGRVFLTGKLDLAAEHTDELALMLTAVFYIILFAGASFSTYIIIAVRFYRNLFSDEGYLTHTLPVTRGRLLLSKTISGSIWAFIDGIMIYLCIYILLSVPALTGPLKGHWNEILTALGFSGQKDLLLFLAYGAAVLAITAVSAIILIQASVLFGQLFNGHKILGAVVSYFVITTLISIISTIIFGAHGILSGQFYGSSASAFGFASYMRELLNITAVLYLIVAILFYGASFFIMKRKTNLS